MSGLVELSKSVYGVQKAKKEPSGGRLVMGAMFPGVHGVVAGRGGKNKAKAAAVEFAPAYASAAAGSLGALLALRRGSVAGWGAARMAGGAGAMASGALGARTAHRRGWLKSEE